MISICTPFATTSMTLDEIVEYYSDTITDITYSYSATTPHTLYISLQSGDMAWTATFIYITKKWHITSINGEATMFHKKKSEVEHVIDVVRKATQ
jgi:hypothetical protein